MRPVWSRCLPELTSTAITETPASAAALHRVGVVCGLTAGLWLGAAEAPTKLVTLGLSPFAVSLWMVAGVFVARWTVPTLIKGTAFVGRDLRERPHLLVWAILAGALWAVANTLTVFAIRDVGLAIAFPLWNANSLIGLLWGRVLFGELEGAGRGQLMRVLAGSVAIVVAAILLGFSTVHGVHPIGSHAVRGVVAALAASILWGTMYVPYRKAYLTGMNPLTFVTAFTVGELGTMLALVWSLDGGARSSAFQFYRFHGVLFWLFLGGFVWVIGDLFQQFAVKYIGIGRGIPLSNTNQLWGLAWGALVFGELAGSTGTQRAMVIGGSLVMIAGALAISSAAARDQERLAWNRAGVREQQRYGVDAGKQGQSSPRRWWDYVIVTVALAVFGWLAAQARFPEIGFQRGWLMLLVTLLLGSLVGSGVVLWRRTGFD